MALYVVDSNFFIQAHLATYPLDIVPGFWNKVEQLAERGTIASIDKVQKELFGNNDELKRWCENNLPEGFFNDTSTNDITTEYKRIALWAKDKLRQNRYLEKAVQEFLDLNEADAFLIAYCLAGGINRIVVTQEISDPKRKNKIKIPDCCNDFNVSYLNTIEMFRQLGETF